MQLIGVLLIMGGGLTIAFATVGKDRAKRWYKSARIYGLVGEKWATVYYISWGGVWLVAGVVLIVISFFE
jgi:hypothetical protein